MKKFTSCKSRFLIVLPFLFALLSVSDSCTKPMDNMYGAGSSTSSTGSSTGTKGGLDGPGKNEVWIQGMAFSPVTITVAAGTSITWTNKNVVAHTVTSNTGLFDSGSINSSGTYSHIFTTTGSYPYHCTIHPSMTASVIVN
jgi:plastocyanin